MKMSAKLPECYSDQVKIFSAKMRDFRQIQDFSNKTKYMNEWLYLNHLIPLRVPSQSFCKMYGHFPYRLPTVRCLQMNKIMVCLLLNLKKCY